MPRTMVVLWSLFLVLLQACLEIQGAVAVITTECEYYDNSLCNSTETCAETQQCETQPSGKRSHCFAVWGNNSGVVTVKMKGCFLNSADCYDQTECISTKPPNAGVYFCCCEGNLCNNNFSYVPMPNETPAQDFVPPVEETSNFNLILLECLIATLIISLAAGIFYLTRRNKRYFNGLATSEPDSMPPASPYLDMRPIQLIEIKARGRFGAVWKAQFKTEEVAVKIFPIQDKQSWQTEKDIFKLPYMNHPNILHYIGVEKRGDNLQAEFWLITAYHERGSLCDFLKAHTLTWKELCRIAESMARGLMHLHEAIPGKSSNDWCKPAVAHRDFKSKNVLLKSDMTACIADFGLALIFEAGKSCGDTHGQVGTRRYMAPEVLEGAINFTPDAFLRIDMYACGLVLWELVSRCTAQDAPIAEYRLPFEEEVGQHPTLEDMQESVVQRKVRPAVQEHWRNNPSLSFMCDTMEECWDHDAEARLSASCVMERVMLHARYQQPLVSWHIENDSPIKDNSM